MSEHARPTWDAMAGHVINRKRTREQRQRQRQRILDQHAQDRRQIDAVTNRTERAELARELRARQEADADRFDTEAKGELQQLAGLLRTAASEPTRDLAHFRRAVPQERPPTVDDVAAPPRPEWTRYAPPPPGPFGRRRYDRSTRRPDVRTIRAW